MDKNYLVKFGQRIRELRQKTGLSQEKFALMIGMDRTILSSFTPISNYVCSLFIR